MYYLHKDFPIVIGKNNYQAITDEQGTLVEKLSFDLWSRRRNPINWTFNDVSNNNLFDRGYTGHEHLDEFGLINPDIFHFITSSGLATSKFSLHYVCENQESSNMNGRVYDPVIGKFLSPDNFVQESANSQNFNRYSYCLNNPLVYSDPSGEFFFFIPNFGYSAKGGFSAGFSFVFGIPNVLSFQFGVGYNFKSNEGYAYTGASAMFNSVYFSTSNGGSVGYTFGLSPYSGVPFSTNFTSVGFDYNISNNSCSGNISAWNIDQNGCSFNPSVSAMIFPEQTTNFIRGKGFISNNKLLERFESANEYQKALKYFQIEGLYIYPLKEMGKTLIIDNDIAVINYGKEAFSSYDNLKCTSFKEEFHKTRFYSGELELLDEECIKYSKEEFLGFKHIYKNQGLFSKTSVDFFSNMDRYQSHYLFEANQYYIKAWWHLIYKIPRKW